MKLEEYMKRHINRKMGEQIMEFAKFLEEQGCDITKKNEYIGYNEVVALKNQFINEKGLMI